MTYYTGFGEGVIYLNGVQIGYTGAHFEPTQTDFFAGIPVGGTVGLTDIGTTTLDLSGVTEPITETLLARISLWNLVDVSLPVLPRRRKAAMYNGKNNRSCSLIIGRDVVQMGRDLLGVNGDDLFGARRYGANDNYCVAMFVA